MVGEDRLSCRDQLRKQAMDNHYGTGYGIGYGTGSAMWHLGFFSGVWYLCYLIVIIKGVTHQSARFML